MVHFTRFQNLKGCKSHFLHNNRSWSLISWLKSIHRNILSLYQLTNKYGFSVMLISQAIRCTWTPHYSNEMLQQPLRSFKPYILRTITRKYTFPMATLSTVSTQNDEAVSTQDESTQIVPKPIQVTPFVYFVVFFLRLPLLDLAFDWLFKGKVILLLFQIDNFRDSIKSIEENCCCMMIFSSEIKDWSFFPFFTI